MKLSDLVNKALPPADKALTGTAVFAALSTFSDDAQEELSRIDRIAYLGVTEEDQTFKQELLAFLNMRPAAEDQLSERVEQFSKPVTQMRHQSNPALFLAMRTMPKDYDTNPEATIRRNYVNLCQAIGRAVPKELEELDLTLAAAARRPGAKP